MSDENTAHLMFTTTDRGFDRMPPIPGSYGGEARMYESSAASGPHLWLDVTVPADLNNPGGRRISATIHLTLDNARKLAEQTLFLVEHHYQIADDD